MPPAFLPLSLIWITTTTHTQYLYHRQSHASLGHLNFLQSSKAEQSWKRQTSSHTEIKGLLILRHPPFGKALLIVLLYFPQGDQSLGGCKQNVSEITQAELQASLLIIIP